MVSLRRAVSAVSVKHGGNRQTIPHLQLVTAIDNCNNMLCIKRYLAQS